MSLFHKQEKVLGKANIPYIPDLVVSRGYSDAEHIPVYNVDWSDLNLTLIVSDKPGGSKITELNVDVSTDETTWQALVDQGLSHHNVPYGVLFSDDVTITTLTVWWSAQDIGSIPSHSDETMAGEHVTSYFEIRQSDGSGPLYMAGEIILTERAGQ